MRSASNLPRAVRNARHSGGMTLIEVLVTLVIISVGLLGVAALQLTTVRSNADAYVRSQAAMLAGDILDRMRSNRSNGQGVSKAAGYVVEVGDDDLPETPEGEDLANWRAVLAAQLPNGRGGIAYDAGTRLVTVTIQWGERAQLEADQLLTFETRSRI